jgi:hypothetical protein
MNDLLFCIQAELTLQSMCEGLEIIETVFLDIKDVDQLIERTQFLINLIVLAQHYK